MDPFLEQSDLISLFGTEPTLLDGAFLGSATGSALFCDATPSGSAATLSRPATSSTSHGRSPTGLSFGFTSRRVVGLEAHQTTETEGPSAVTGDAAVGLLHIQVSTDVSVIWAAPASDNGAC